MLRRSTSVMGAGCVKTQAPSEIGERSSTAWAAEGEAAIRTVVDTARLSGANPFGTILKRMARPVRKWLGSAGLCSLHKRIRPSGEPLAKMEIRASWAS